MSKFTPGPWSMGADWNQHQFENLIYPSQTDDDRGPSIICEVSESRPEALDNARLISAAPDLLAACQEALMSGVPPETFARLKSAIAKASDETGD